MIGGIKALLRIYPRMGSKWRLNHEVPWTSTVFTVARAEEGWVGLEYPPNVVELYHRPRIEALRLREFYRNFIPYQMSPETRADQIADRLNPVDKQEDIASAWRQLQKINTLSN